MVSRAPLPSTIYCFKSMFEARDSVSWLWDYWTRFLLPPSTCEGPAWPLPQLQRTCVRQSQNDDCPLSGVGSYLSVTVPWLSPRQAQTWEVPSAEAQNVFLFATNLPCIHQVDGDCIHRLETSSLTAVFNAILMAPTRLTGESPQYHQKTFPQFCAGLSFAIHNIRRFFAPPLVATIPLN